MFTKMSFKFSKVKFNLHSGTRSGPNSKFRVILVGIHDKAEFREANFSPVEIFGFKNRVSDSVTYAESNAIKMLTRFLENPMRKTKNKSSMISADLS